MDSNVAKSLEEFKQLIKSQDDLDCPEDDEFLLRFLRAKNFNVESALKTLLNYLEMRKGFPTSFYPSAVKNALESGMVRVLKNRDPEGRQIFYFRTQLWDPNKVSADDVFVACTLVMEEMLNSVETQQNGIVFLHDLDGLTFSHCKLLGLNQMKRVYRVKGAFPAKFKKAHGINHNTATYILHSIATSLLSKKLRERLIMYGKDLKSLHKNLPPQILPTVLGGHLDMEDALDHQLMERLKGQDNYFKATSDHICREILNNNSQYKNQ